MKTRQTVAHVPLERLTAHPANIRDDLGDLEEMARSIIEHGILQPLTATEDPEHDGRLLLLAGHRRLGAACLAKLDTVPVIIRHDLTDPAEHLVVMLVENTHRRDLNPVERAEAYGALRNRGLTISEIARRTGAHVSTISYYLNLLMLSPVERQQVLEGELASTHAIAAVRDARQEARKAEGAPLRGRPKNKPTTTAWFGPSHRLARTVQAICDHVDEPMVGKAGCGACWERAIVAEAGGEELSPAHMPYDEAVVLRRLNGDQTARMRKADRREVVRRAHAQGLTDLQIADLTGISDQTVYRVRIELCLEPNGNGRHKDNEEKAS